MNLFFVDEAGDLGKRVLQHEQAGSEFFIVGGLAIPDTYWLAMKGKLERVKFTYGLRGVSKVKFSDIGSQDPDNPLAKLLLDRRRELALDILQIVLDFPWARILSIVVHKQSAYAQKFINRGEDLFTKAYSLLLEQYQHYLQNVLSTEYPVYGIVVQDPRERKEDELARELFRKLTEEGSYYTPRFNNIIDALYLCPSEFSTGLQIADFCIGALFRAQEHADLAYLSKISSKINREVRTDPLTGEKKQGKWFGVHYYPERLSRGQEDRPEPIIPRSVICPK